MSVISLTVDSCSLNYRAREDATPAYFCISSVERANNVPTTPPPDADAERRLNKKTGEVLATRGRIHFVVKRYATV
jgi:hypothetical protein